MPGTLVLQGGAPFESHDELDRRVLAASDIDRIVMLPTAEAFEQPQVLVDSAEAWGRRVGVAVDPLMVLARAQADADAAAAVRDAGAVFLAGDSGIHLRGVLKGTPLFDAIRQVLVAGGLVIAAGPSASALCDPMTDERGGAYALGLGLVDGMAVITGCENWSHEKLDRAHSLADTTVVDLPTGAALVRTEGGWELVGSPIVHGELPL